MFDQGIVSREQGDQLRTNANALAQSVLADKAAIESSRSQILADQAMIANAKVQLGYTSIRSPIDGRTGNLMVKQGNVVTANTSDLITINQIEPIYVTFAVPEVRLPEIKRYMAQGKLPVIAKSQDSEAQPEQAHQGRPLPHRPVRPYAGSSSRLRFICPHKHMILGGCPHFTGISHLPASQQLKAQLATAVLGSYSRRGS